MLRVLKSDCDSAGKLQRLNAVLKDFEMSALDLKCLLLFFHTHYRVGKWNVAPKSSASTHMLFW